ncbi:SMEK domain-containing protein [Bifidobacterium crudilactis]|uniref:SMEK domain-containing protein n=1 Tax=Bifidobacterium crudilactis TaxID=327277 RepID=UPI0023561A3D|nr:SMEK domain-containing protein [Bifidobacterium crudilactis]MCI1868237.1 SMEK domain-containing protein [Bifidobacterium crudilactis]
MVNQSNIVLLTSIQLELGALCAAAKIGSGVNNSQISILAEDICRPVLNLVYSANFVNANILKHNTKGFDLVDESTKQVIQVSTQDRKVKRDKTLENILSISGPDGKSKYKDYTIRFLSLAKFDKPEKSSGQLELITVETIFEFLMHLQGSETHEKLSAIESHLDEWLFNFKTNIDRPYTPSTKPVAVSINDPIIRQIDEYDKNTEDYDSDYALANTKALNGFQRYIFDNIKSHTGRKIVAKLYELTFENANNKTGAFGQDELDAVAETLRIGKRIVRQTIEKSDLTDYVTADEFAEDTFHFDGQAFTYSSMKGNNYFEDFNPVTDLLVLHFDPSAVASFIADLDFSHLEGHVTK